MRSFPSKLFFLNTLFPTHLAFPSSTANLLLRDRRRGNVTSSFVTQQERNDRRRGFEERGASQLGRSLCWMPQFDAKKFALPRAHLFPADSLVLQTRDSVLQLDVLGRKIFAGKGWNFFASFLNYPTSVLFVLQNGGKTQFDAKETTNLISRLFLCTRAFKKAE